MKVTNTTNVQCYKLRELEYGAWADIYIDEFPNGGSILILSDYGSWNYKWGASGKSFKKFLTSINDDYLTIKLLHDREKEYRHKETVNMLKESAYQAMKEDFFGITEYESALQEIENIEQEGFNTSEGLIVFMRENDYNLFNYFSEAEGFPEFDHVPRQLEMFVKNIWHNFVDVLKKELLEEDNQVLSKQINIDESGKLQDYMPAQPMGLVCEYSGCQNTPVKDYKRKPQDFLGGWGDEPICLCKEHADEYELFS